MNKFNCLLYHQIKNNGDKYTLSQSSFIRQLDLINSHRYNATSIDKIGMKDSFNGVAITFDDGFKSDLWVGEKLLEYGYSATFYLVKDFIESNSNIYLNRQHVKQLAIMGHEIGVHGKTHDAWTLKPKDIVLTELIETKNWLEDLTGVEVSTCSAPGGKINREIIKELTQSDQFKSVRNSIPWFNSINAFEINATVILRDDYDSSFLKKLNGDTLYYNYLFSKQKLKDRVIKKLIEK